MQISIINNIRRVINKMMATIMLISKAINKMMGTTMLINKVINKIMATIMIISKAINKMVATTMIISKAINKMVIIIMPINRATTIKNNMMNINTMKEKEHLPIYKITCISRNKKKVAIVEVKAIKNQAQDKHTQI